MAMFSKDIEGLDGLFLHTLRDIYYAEKQIEQALPKMIDKASDSTLRSAFEEHLEETHEHVSRLDRVFGEIGETASGVNCPAIDGIIEEANEISGEIGDAKTLDAALAAAAQAVEHYEMSRYGSLVAWADQLGHGEVSRILGTTLEEEKAADAKLTSLAKDQLNVAA